MIPTVVIVRTLLGGHVDHHELILQEAQGGLQVVLRYFAEDSLKQPSPIREGFVRLALVRQHDFTTDKSTII